MANTTNIRIINKRTSDSSVIPTIPNSNNHTDGTWISTDIYEGEFFINTNDNKVFTRCGNEIIDVTENEKTEIDSLNQTILQLQNEMNNYINIENKKQEIEINLLKQTVSQLQNNLNNITKFKKEFPYQKPNIILTKKQLPDVQIKECPVYWKPPLSFLTRKGVSGTNSYFR